MRAIENRVAIARSATSGQSLFIDQFGRRYQTSEIFTEAALVGNVPVAQSGSFLQPQRKCVCTQLPPIFSFLPYRSTREKPHRPMTDKSSYPVETDGKDGPLQPSESGEMAFLDHLEELRWRILRSLIAILLGLLCALPCPMA